MRESSVAMTMRSKIWASVQRSHTCWIIGLPSNGMRGFPGKREAPKRAGMTARLLGRRVFGMTSGKIDRHSPVLQPKRADAPSGPVSTAKVAEVKSKEPENLFGARSKTLDPVTGPDGKAVSTS